ncbi:MAG: hypothetical protein GXP55_09185 [Deltaproteobacteria bacterium]|nr:hypothetical protein [Deltaproteobacteria bacterium]
MRRLLFFNFISLLTACGGGSSTVDSGADASGADASTDSATRADVGAPADSGADAGPTGSRLARLAAVNDFAYFIQDPDLAALGASAFDMLVIDYSADGSDDTAFTRAQIDALKASGDGKLVIAYMSLGEAEDYRFYWELAAGAPGADWRRSAPAWLGPTNPDWAGNYKVRYWDPEWQGVVVHNPGGNAVLGDAPSYLDRILAAGFDGVFLDIVDGYEYWGPSGDGGNGERPDAATDMANLLSSLSDYAHTVDPEFIVCQQNGSSLPSAELSRPLDAAHRAALFEAVDWISVEDVFYRGGRDANNPLNPDTFRIPLINAYRDAGEKVTVIDYFDPTVRRYDAAKVDDYFARAQAEGWVPTSGPRNLDRLIIYPGHEPD